MLGSRGGLAVAELVFYIPALFISAFVAFRHGFRRQLGWIFLVILSLIRILGSSMEIAFTSKPSESLEIGALVLQGVGLSPLLLAMLGMLNRVHEGMANGRGLPHRFFRLLMLPILVALILSIIGGTDVYNSSATTVQKGRSLIQTAIILYAVGFGALVAITSLGFLNIGAISQGEKRILIAVALAIPFITVRLLYAIISDFDSSNATFNSITGSVIVRAFMTVLEEFVVVILFIGAGLLAPKIARSEVVPGAHFGAAGTAPRDQEKAYQTVTPTGRKEAQNTQNQHSGSIQRY